MKYGYHLPQYGRAAVAGAIPRAARLAEELGYADVWVSDHLVIPVAQPYPAPFLYDPIMSMAFAAASTERVGVGSAVLVGPQYTSPLALANTLASLDNMSFGRLILGIGIGWSQGEYEALHAPFDHRGERLDEMIDLFRTTWRDDPATHEGKFYAYSEMRVLPKPAREVPIWIGGASDAAFARAFARGDGYAGIGVAPGDAKAFVERIRASRPEEEFTISMRVAWDANKMPADEILAEHDAFKAAGVQHIIVAPDRGDLDAWLAGMQTIADLLDVPASAT